MNKVIEIKNLTVRFRHRKAIQTALDDVSFSVNEGSTVGFIGPNGAGKTTTLHVLLGFIAPESGRATLFGESTRNPAARQRIGYLSEHPEFYRFMTGREFLDTAARLFGMPAAQRRGRTGELLELVNLSTHADKRIATYSRGMLQRIGIAQALINDPELLILDEPTNGMDPIGRLAIRSLIENLRAAGKTIFFSSHELSEIETICDEIIMINQGRIIRQGSVGELTSGHKSLEQYFIESISAEAEGVLS